MTVKSVTFTFESACSEDEQKRTLAEIEHWQGVEKVRYLKPGARNRAIARMAYAVLASDADEEQIVSHLDRLPGVESASLPAPRSLASKRS